MNKESIITRIAWGFCILAGIALSLKSLREPDLWWMYRTGEWMLENGQVTKTDPFSYTFAGAEWVNVKWLFEIIIATGKGLFGVEFIFVLQAIVTSLILFLFYKTSLLIKENLSQNQQNASLPFVGLVLAALLLLFTVDFRMIGRPEMTSHLMVSAYLFLFWKYHYAPSKMIFALIPLQMLWANMHEGFGTGMILMLGYLAATWVQHFYLKKKNQPTEMPKLLTMAVVGALAAIVLNPRGYQMWLHPLEIFNQLENNQYTTELASIDKALYWEKEAYLSMFFITISLAFLVLTPFLFRQTITKEVVTTTKDKNKKEITTTKTVTETLPVNWLLTNVQKYGLGNGLVFLMLFYLSTTAYRNIPFFIIAAAPILAMALDYGIEKIKSPKWLSPLALVLVLCFYTSIVSGKYHEWAESRDIYGLQVLSSHNPVGAAQFIQDNKITGRCFSDYLTSSYLLWKLQPEFKTFIDLRDLDIFPMEFFSEFINMTAIPAKFEEKDDSLDFDYVVLFRPQFATLHKYLVESPEYDLVFADPVACVYLKNKAQNQTLIAKYGFTANGFKDIFSNLTPVQSTMFPYTISKILNPFYIPTNYAETDIDAIASSFYLNLKHTNLAIQRANASVQSGKQPWGGNELLGNIYNNFAFAPETPDSLRKDYIKKANYHYNQALATNPTYVGAMIGKATISMQQQDFQTAINYFNQVLEIDPKHLTAIQYMGMCYKFLANQNRQDPAYLQQWLDYMLLLDRLNPSNPYILLDIGIAYCLLKDCPNAVEYLKGIIEVPGLPAEELKTAKRCIQQCGS